MYPESGGKSLPPSFKSLGLHYCYCKRLPERLSVLTALPERSDQWRGAIRLISHRHSFHLQSKDLLIRSNLKVNQPAFSSSPSRGLSHPIQFYLSWSTPAHPKALSPTAGILALSPNPVPSFKPTRLVALESRLI